MRRQQIKLNFILNYWQKTTKEPTHILYTQPNIQGRAMETFGIRNDLVFKYFTKVKDTSYGLALLKFNENS
jgi:hypothetical protein